MDEICHILQRNLAHSVARPSFVRHFVELMYVRALTEIFYHITSGQAKERLSTFMLLVKFVAHR